MKHALVATASYLLLVNLESRDVIPLEQHRSEYYGISWTTDGEALVLSHSGVNNADLIDIASYAQSERGYLSQGSMQSRAFLSAPHQILCAEDGRVICANTGRNVISVFDFKKPNTFQEAGISDGRWDRLTLEKITGDHLNSVFLREKQLYVIAHGHRSGSKLAVFDYPSLTIERVESLGSRTGLHNIWITAEGQRISCHSETGSLVDLDSKAPLWESGSAVYTRGLAASADYVLVGESAISGRDLRRSSMSGLWILDRRTWDATDYFCLGPYGVVNEVRILDVPDEAHHGRVFKSIDSLTHSNLPLETRKLRLEMSKKVCETRVLWKNFEPVLGTPDVAEDGYKAATSDQLCLAVMSDGEQPNLVFDYRIEDVAGCHVSAVLGYAGRGSDVNMAALLLQPNGSGGATLSAWNNDGHEWHLLPTISETNLPLAGRLELNVNPNEGTLSADGIVFARFSKEDLRIPCCNLGLGIRWLGASVRPREAL
jgi:hypothetical protein